MGNGNRVDFDEYTDDYNRLLKEKTQFFSPSEEYFARYKVEIVRRRVAAPVKRLLEYGCGIGRNIPFLQHAFPGATIVGTDISKASLDIARTENPGVEFLEESEATPDLTGFDVVFIAGVFHHIPPPQRVEVARKVAQRMTPGSSLFVFEHNPYNPVTRRIVNTCPYDEDAVLLRPGEMKQILKEAGFTFRRREFCLFVPPSLPAFLPLENVLGWLPLGGQYWVEAHLPGQLPAGRS
jgi:SAM-dependent methyltransferase